MQKKLDFRDHLSYVNLSHRTSPPCRSFRSKTEPSRGTWPSFVAEHLPTCFERLQHYLSRLFSNIWRIWKTSTVYFQCPAAEHDGITTLRHYFLVSASRVDAILMTVAISTPKLWSQREQQQPINQPLLTCCRLTRTSISGTWPPVAMWPGPQPAGDE